MSPIVVHRRHGLKLTEVRELAERMAGQLRREYGGSYHWEGDTLRFSRPGASGHVAVTRRDLEIRVDVGLLLTPLRSRIEREIEAFVDAHVGAPSPDQPDRPASRRSAGPRSSSSQGASRSVRPK